MQAFRLLSWKSLFWSILLLVILALAPDALHSQTAAPSTKQGTETSSTRAAKPAAKPAPTRPPARTPTTKKTSESTKDEGLSDTDLTNVQRPSLITQAVLITLMSLLPFIIMILTSFLKIVVVLSLLRSALGVQNAPPNQVLNGVAFLLSLFVMYPTGVKNV